MVRGTYEWFDGGYEWFVEHTSGSTADTSGSRNIRVVRRRIRAVRGIYEWFAGGYERLSQYTSGSTTDTSGSTADTSSHRNIQEFAVSGERGNQKIIARTKSRCMPLTNQEIDLIVALPLSKNKMTIGLFTSFPPIYISGSNYTSDTGRDTSGHRNIREVR